MKFILIISIFAVFILTIVSCKSKLGSEFIIGEKINFQNRNGSFKFTAIPSMGRDYEMMERQFDTFIKENKVLPENTVIYRTTKKNYFKFSKWSEFKKMPEWQYPYLPVFKR